MRINFGSELLLLRLVACTDDDVKHVGNSVYVVSMPAVLWILVRSMR